MEISLLDKNNRSAIIFSMMSGVANVRTGVRRYVHKYVRTDGRTGGRADRRAGRWSGGQTDRQTDGYNFIIPLMFPASV